MEKLKVGVWALKNFLKTEKLLLDFKHTHATLRATQIQGDSRSNETVLCAGGADEGDQGARQCAGQEGETSARRVLPPHEPDPDPRVRHHLSATRRQEARRRHLDAVHRARRVVGPDDAAVHGASARVENHSQPEARYPGEDACVANIHTCLSDLATCRSLCDVTTRSARYDVAVDGFRFSRLCVWNRETSPFWLDRCSK